MPTPRRYASQAERQAAYRQRQAEARSKGQAAKGLPPLPAIASLPGRARWQGLLGQAGQLLRTVEAEMQEYYDGRSERWQEGERGETFLERLQAIQEAQAALEDLRR